MSVVGSDTGLDLIAWPVHTERLRLRPATAADARATWEFRQLPEFARWMTAAPNGLDAYEAQFNQPAWLDKALVIEMSGSVIGDLMLAVQDGWAQAEVTEQARAVEADLGWGLHPQHGGKGYATEAVRELLRICFDDLGVRRVTASCFADNGASWRLMERVGMRRESYTRQDALHRDGAWLDSMGYALLRDEWILTSVDAESRSEVRSPAG
jgi:RimJ/RimL family protein N-acetyltransferase